MVMDAFFAMSVRTNSLKGILMYGGTLTALEKNILKQAYSRFIDAVLYCTEDIPAELYTRIR